MTTTNKNELALSLGNNLPELTAMLGLNVKEKVDDLEQIVRSELAFLELHALTKPNIHKCDKLSVLLALKSMFKQNLSLDPSLGLVYVKTRKVKTGEENGRDVYSEILELQPTCNGILSINRQCGVILDYEDPELERDENGKIVSVKFRYLTPSIGEDLKRKAVWKEKKFDKYDFERWQMSSHKENSRGYNPQYGKDKPSDETLNYSNKLYTSYKGGIDPEFAKAKAIKHTFKKSATNPNERIFDVSLINDTRTILVSPSVAMEETEEELSQSYSVNLDTNFSEKKSRINLDNLQDAEEINVNAM